MKPAPFCVALAVLSLSALALPGCPKEAARPEPSDSAAPPPREEGKEPVACHADADCAAPCGPCTDGALITARDRERECVVNPCPDAMPVCAPDQKCRVLLTR